MPTHATRFATIDVGTNTALLLVAEAAPDGILQIVGKGRRVVRLGEGVDASGRVGRAAMERLREALLAYKEKARSLDAEIVTVGATSASRDAANKDELVAFVREETGLPYTILSGKEEAYWSFRAATSVLTDPPAACAVMDIGGGSTELIVGAAGDAEAGLRARHSFNLGTVRLTERLFASQPPTAGAVAAATAAIDETLAAEGAALRAAFDEPLPLLGVAGTMVSLAFLAHGVRRWEDIIRYPVPIPATDVTAWRKRLFRLDYEGVYNLHPGLMNGRADVFPMGVLIVERVLQHFPIASLAMSPRGLQYGLALRHLERAQGAP